MSYFNELDDDSKAEMRKKAAETKKAATEANKAKRFTTLRAAVNAHCKGCIYDPLAGGNWLQQVTACTVTNCEMYEWRPLTKGIK
jgi:hypothetical protein